MRLFACAISSLSRVYCMNTVRPYCFSLIRREYPIKRTLPGEQTVNPKNKHLTDVITAKCKIAWRECYSTLLHFINVPSRLLRSEDQYNILLFQIQFAIMVAHTFQALLPACEPTRKPLAYIYMSQVAFMFYMFLDYYRKSYLRKKIE